MQVYLNDYVTEFQKSIERTDEWGMCAPYFKSYSHGLLDGKEFEVNALLQDVLGGYSAEEVSQQCFAVNFILKEELEHILGAPLIYTLGYVELYQHNIFYTSLSELKAFLSNPVTMGPVNLHAWLTTPSYEIIDATFFTTYGVVKRDKDYIGTVMMQHHSSFTNDIKHHPQVIGEDYLFKIGGIVQLK